MGTPWLRSKMKKEDIIKGISKDAMESLCREYDQEKGEYPEHDYEGCALYNYFCWMKDTFGEEGEVEEYVKNVLDGGVEYSRYTAMDILQLLPEPYILGKYHDLWYCKDSTDSWGDIVYYKTAEDACAAMYEKLLNGDRRKGGE